MTYLTRPTAIDERVNHASEELGTGDSDDSPLSEKKSWTCSDYPRIAASDPCDPDAASELQKHYPHSTHGVRLRLSFGKITADWNPSDPRVLTDEGGRSSFP
jgi:hypothetical protein